MVNNYSVPDKTIKALERVEKLRGSNLFEYYADKLAECIEADLRAMCRRIEELSFSIDRREATPELLDFCEWFAEWALDDVLLDEHNRAYKIAYL